MTWRLDKTPEDSPTDIKKIGNHRSEYLDYEGEISENRGTVAIHSKGTYEWDGKELQLRGGPSEGEYAFDGQNLLDVNRP